MKIRCGDVTIATARKKDLAELEELYVEACGYFKFDRDVPLRSPEVCLAGGDLPEGGLPENYELLTMRVNDMLIGYAAVYREFPSKTAVHVPVFFIGAPARGSGFGTLCAQMLCRYFYETGYDCIRTCVSLRNWSALRFCNRLGFDRIISLTAEGTPEDGSYAGMCLEKALRQIEAPDFF